MDVGFVILCPDKNTSGLKLTISSIVTYFDKNSNYLAVVSEDVPTSDLKQMKEICTVHKAKNTITSLINLGMKKLKSQWAFLMFSGSRVQPYAAKKLTMFTKSDKDVLFPVVDRKWDFVEGSFNGVLVNSSFFHEVGDFPDTTFEKTGMNDFELAKLLWALDALKKGAVFKGIVGMKMN